MGKILFCLLVLVMLGCSDLSPPSVSVGEVGILSREKADASPLAVSEAALEQLFKLQKAGGQNSVTWMIVDGLICAINNGTRVKVFEIKADKAGVIILEGQFGGRSGYVLREWVKPLK